MKCLLAFFVLHQHKTNSGNSYNRSLYYIVSIVSSRGAVSHHHHHHIQEGLGLFLFLVSSKWNWSLRLFLGRPVCLRPFGLYCSACLGILFVSILCMCCSHFSWYCFISFTIFSAPVFSLIHWFFFIVLLFQEGVLKISTVLLLNVVPLFSSVRRLHFRISMLL